MTTDTSKTGLVFLYIDLKIRYMLTQQFLKFRTREKIRTN